MNRTKIDWADMTWNPVTGCLHGCEYCYARKIAKRFGNKYLPYGTDINVLTSKVSGQYGVDPYLFGFEPTLHEYRLDEPSKIKQQQTIFVCSMADLFGKWVPKTWIESVIDACNAAPQHRYLFLTKNPDRYQDYQQREIDRMYFGASATTQMQMNEVTKAFCWLTKEMKRFVSIEPILEPIHLELMKQYDWVIVGAETGNRKGKVIPEKKWVDDILAQCVRANVPIFMKESLRPLMCDDFVQEFPWRNNERGTV